jgi:hypothetical protein
MADPRLGGAKARPMRRLITFPCADVVAVSPEVAAYLDAVSRAADEAAKAKTLAEKTPPESPPAPSSLHYLGAKIRRGLGNPSRAWKTRRDWPEFPACRASSRGIAGTP